MSGKRRSGLTLLELIVLIVVAAMLLFLLIPWLLQSRQISARRALCINNQHQLSTALLQYEAAREHFPGYVNRVELQEKGKYAVTSWVIPLLPHLERNDLWKQWTLGQQPKAYLHLLACPSDNISQTGVGIPMTDYVVNAGKSVGESTPADGVCLDLNVDKPAVVSLHYINQHDGAAYTLLLSENIQAGWYTDTDKADVGMTWSFDAGRTSLVNQGKDTAGDRPHDIRYARPSSQHPGGVVASFCDGHQQFISQDIDYRVYEQLMTPDSKAAGIPGGFRPEEVK